MILLGFGGPTPVSQRRDVLARAVQNSENRARGPRASNGGAAVEKSWKIEFRESRFKQYGV